MSRLKLFSQSIAEHEVVFTQAALKDLDDILNHLRANFPTLIDHLKDAFKQSPHA